MQRGAQILAGLALAVTALGVGSVILAYDVIDMPANALGYLSVTATRPLVWLSAICAVASFTTATAIDAFARRSRPITARAPPEPAAPLSEVERQRQLRSVTASLEAVLRDKRRDMVGFVDALIAGSIETRASDIHIHPLAAGTRIAFRIDGLLYEIATLASELHHRLIGRLKVVAKLVTYRKNEPQDGHFSVSTTQGPAEIRVSLLPTNHGETAVLRIATTAVRLPDLSTLGMPPAVLQRYIAILARAQGLVYLTGPTGSGKTTTIYGSIGHMERTRGGSTHIATIEDPIEYNVPTLSQTQVNPGAGLTFAKGLRSLLRQDPNVLMVGEIRDAETAEIAGQAGLTGHLILTTIHADSAAGVFNRLADIGVEPFVIASASLACVSQRLVRRTCPDCRAEAAATDEERERLLLAGVDIGDERFWVGTGCATCSDGGFIGRLPVFELLEVTPGVRELITRKVPTSDMHNAAVADGMVPLLQAAIDVARTGETTLAEVVRIGA